MFIHPGYEGLKVISVEKDGDRKRVAIIENMGTNVSTNEVVRHFSNLTVKGC